MFEKSSVQSGVPGDDFKRLPSRARREAAEVRGPAAESHPGGFGPAAGPVVLAAIVATYAARLCSSARRATIGAS